MTRELRPLTMLSGVVGVGDYRDLMLVVALGVFSIGFSAVFDFISIKVLCARDVLTPDSSSSKSFTAMFLGVH